MFVHLVLSTVVETLQLVLAPPSAAPKSQECCQVGHCWRDPQICLPMLSRTPPVCGYGYHGGMAFATKLAHPKWVKSCSKEGVIFVFSLSSCMIQSFLWPIQGLGAKVEVIHANIDDWHGCRGWCKECQERLSNVQSLWFCEVVGQLISHHQKTLFFFQAWLPCFAFLRTAEALVHATKRSSENVGGSMVLQIGNLPIHFARIAGHLAGRFWGLWSLWSLFELWAPNFSPASQPVWLPRLLMAQSWPQPMGAREVDTWEIPK